MKKILSIITLLILLFVVPVANLDIGPKPSVNISFNAKDPLYVTLLSKTESTGPYSVNDDYTEFSEEEKPIHEFFKNFKDEYYYLNTFDLVEDGSYHWTYYPPHDFKILIYNPRTGDYLLSKELERYAFDTYYKLEINQNFEIVDISKNYNYLTETANLALRIVLTIAVEVAIAYFLFKIRRQNEVKIIFIVNVFTQVMLNVIITMTNYFEGYLAYFIIFYCLEVVVFFIELGVYKVWFSRYKFGRIFLYTLLANFASFSLGYLISRFIPGVL